MAPWCVLVLIQVGSAALRERLEHQGFCPKGNIPALAAGKRAFRQLRLVFAYRNSGILPGEEMVYAGIATSVIGTNIPPERQYLIFGKAKEQG